MKIITISREFGSGGRELGKRLSDLLGFDYYDREIITAVAEAQGMDEDYVEKTLEDHGWQSIQLTYNSSFISGPLLQTPQMNLMLEQQRVISGIAKLGKDCVIVGRNADVLLADYNPFNIFVCADMEAKIQRCMERAEEGENLTRKEIEQNIRRIDRNRARTREIIADTEWGASESYHITVNTTGWNLKDLVSPVAQFATCWFAAQERK